MIMTITLVGGGRNLPMGGVCVFVRLQKGAVDAALQELLPRDAKLVFRRYYLGQSYQQIAQGLGMTVNLVGVCLARARERMRQRLMERYPGLFMEYGDTKPSKQTLSKCVP